MDNDKGTDLKIVAAITTDIGEEKEEVGGDTVKQYKKIKMRGALKGGKHGR